MAFDDVKAAAYGNWASILGDFGITVRRKHHTACPGCGGSDRFNFKDNTGNGDWFCSGGGELRSGDGFDLLAHVFGWSHAEALREVGASLGVSGASTAQERATLAAELRKREQEYKAQHARMQKERHDLAQQWAQWLLERAQPASADHPYLTRKGIEPKNLFQVGKEDLIEAWKQLSESGNVHPDIKSDCLLVPLSSAGVVHNIEVIPAREGSVKLGLPGGKRNGVYMRFNGSLSGVVLCEGYATAYSVWLATKRTVIMCCTASNLVDVATAIHASKRLAGQKIVVAADNDKAGLKYGQQAADLLGAVLVTPEIEGFDFDDVRINRGIDAVAGYFAFEEGQAPAPEATGTSVHSEELTDEEQKAVDESEDFIAEKFATAYVDKYLYVNTVDSWYYWTGHNWRKDTLGRHLHSMRMLCRGNAKALAEIADGEAKTKESRMKLARAQSGIRLHKNALEMAQSAPEMRADYNELDQNHWLLGTPGGTVDLRTGELRNALQGDMITKLAAVTPTDSADCPTWIDFLDWATGGDAELLYFLQRAIGYALTGVIREHSLVFLHGSGGNGKGVFLNTVQGIMSDYAKTAVMDVFTETRGSQHSTDIAMLHGARLVCAQETQEGRNWDKQKVTQLTGGDPITARFMRKDNFTFLPTFKIFISGNHKPNLRNVDESMRRRLNLVPFTQSLTQEQRDPLLHEKLRSEWPGILRWMIDGCLEWQRIGLKPPESVVNASREYLNDEDSLSEWIAECCVKGANKQHQAALLFKDWAQWCEDQCLPQGNAKSFYKALEAKGFTKRVGTGNKLMIMGICLLSGTELYSEL